MIYSVKGILIHSEPTLAVIECGGVGYSCRTTLSTISNIKLGDVVTLYTYLAVREDNIELFGFYDKSELNCFKLLISVSGVGPKAALSILSTVSPQSLALCIVTGDSKSLTKAPGVGAKIAQRIILELKDKFAKENDLTMPVDLPLNISASSNSSEAIAALVVLGFPQSMAVKAVSSLDPSTAVEEMIKHGLKVLAKNQ